MLQPRPPASASATEARRPVLAVIDLDQPALPTLVRAAAAAGTWGSPLLLVGLHHRLGFSADAAVRNRRRAWLGDRVAEVATMGRDLAVRAGLPAADVRVTTAPFATWPHRDPAEQARRTVARLEAAGRPRLTVLAPHLRTGTAPMGGDRA